MEKSNIIGLYGCNCHPFRSWDDHDYFHKQKFNPGQLVKIRHSGEFAYIIDKMDHQKFYNINRLPCLIPRDKTFEHVSNLIPESKFTKDDKFKFLIHSNFKEIRETLVNFDIIKNFHWNKVFLILHGVNLYVYRNSKGKPSYHEYFIISNCDFYRLNSPFYSRNNEFIKEAERIFKESNIYFEYLLF